MKTDEMVNLLKGMLSGKETILQTLSDSLEESTRIQKGLGKAKDSVLDNPSEANFRKSTTFASRTFLSSIVSPPSYDLIAASISPVHSAK